MVSKNQIKLIASLQQKKIRIQEKLFIAEGIKVIQELLKSNYVLDHLYTLDNDFDEVDNYKKTIVTETELKKMSALHNANTCLAIFKIPASKKINQNGLLIALDDIRDPGNLGTIIRLCDWFGVSELICSKNTVDLYNPKVVQATMGSLARVNINYVDLKTFFHETTLPIFGTFMNGNNIYKEKLPSEGIIIMGNEANGISQEIEKFITKPLTIPRFGDLQQTESLNVANATAIILSEFKRNS